MAKTRKKYAIPGKLKYQKLIPVPVNQVRVRDEFWSPKLDMIRKVTIHDVFEKFHKDRGGAVENFDRVARGESGFHAGPPWFDGLIWESMRGSADFLAMGDDRELDAKLDNYIERIAAAQDRDPDGYIHTWVTLLSPETRWGKNGGNIVWQHDVYNAGCLIEAGVHHYRATGKTSLLKIAVKFADYMCRIMGAPPKENIVPAHALPEEAVIKLYQLFQENPNLKNRFSPKVDEEKYLSLVKFWIDWRGRTEGRQAMGEYAQDHKPVVEMDEIVGHAVRATLLFTGVTALAMAAGDKAYFDTAKRVWKNAVTRRMYITGAGGAHQHEEKFGGDYDLPNDGYLETCAAVAMGFWHHNMNLAFGDAKYVDELERTLYNGVLVGVSLTGNKYFYTNPLICKDHNRWGWHGCPCCPPMLLKILGSLPSYIYAYDEAGIYVNLYIGSTARIPFNGGEICIEQETRYPWDGIIRLIVQSGGQFAVHIRVPGWVNGNPSCGDLYRFVDASTEEMAFSVNGEPATASVKKGYMKIYRSWQKEDQILCNIPLPARRIKSNSKVKANTGKVAILRGPFVYCLEGIDNNDEVEQLYIPHIGKLTADYQPDLLGGISLVFGDAEKKGALIGKVEKNQFHAIPYYAQNNRGSSSMGVWLDTGMVPEIYPGSTIFLDHQVVSVFAAFGDCQVHFTTNGRNPTVKSPVYREPFTLTETTVVKARSYQNGKAISPVVIATYKRVNLRQPDTPGNVVPGLTGEYYAREVKKQFPDFTKIKPDVSKVVPEISLDIAELQHNFVVRFTGYLKIEKAGIYTFFLSSEGLSQISIGGETLVTNQGSSGMKEMTGKIALAKGKHVMEVFYCQRGGGKVLQVNFEGPGIKKQPIPGKVCFTAST